MSGNSKRRSRAKRRNREKVWDFHATKSMLLPGNPTLNERLVALGLPASGGKRKLLEAALHRAGVNPPDTFQWDFTPGKVWNKCPSGYKQHYTWLDEFEAITFLGDQLDANATSAHPGQKPDPC